MLTLTGIKEPFLDAKPPLTSEIVVTSVPDDFLANEFIDSANLIARAAKASNGRYEAADFFDACWRGDLVMWIVVRLHSDQTRKTLGVVFTGINEYPRSRGFCLRYAAGIEIGAWAALFYTRMEEVAKEQNCAFLEGVCRPGWQRVLKKFGTKPTALLLELRL